MMMYKKAMLRCIGFALLLLLSAPAMAADSAPTFNGGASQSLAACYNGSAVSLNSYLTITDADLGQTETWTVLAAPVHGSLAGLPAFAFSNGSSLSPAGTSYTPAAGYSGADSFTIQVSDGTLTATTKIYVTVYAPPTLSSTLTPTGICNGATFSYTPTSATSGATFAWTRPFTGGISNPSTSGTGNISETLSNVTYYDVPVTYEYTISAHGCSSYQNVTVTVHPTLSLSSAASDTTCTGGTFTYVPTSYTSGTTYMWSRAAVAGISPAVSSGTGSISEELTSSDSVPVTVVYSIVLTANGCTATRNVSVTVVPQPPITSITTASPSKVCAGTMYQNFGAGIAPPAGATYVWSAVNADIAAVGNTGQYCLVSFPTPGDASVMLNIIMAGAHCTSNGTYAVNVGAASGAVPAGILLYNFQLVYLDNTQDSYQWGYDNAHTLDSSLIPGAVFQSYPFGTTLPDLVNNYYWVMTTKGGCMQKTYFNSPTAVTNVNQPVAAMNVYPNPAGNTLDVDVKAGTPGATTQVTVMNMLGENIKTISATGSRMQLNIAELPAGCYFVSSVQNGVRIATARFIKN